MLHSECLKCGFGIAIRVNASETESKITDKTNCVMSVLLCTSISALADTENADLKSQEDFKEGECKSFYSSCHSVPRMLF